MYSESSVDILIPPYFGEYAGVLQKRIFKENLVTITHTSKDGHKQPLS